MILIPAIDLKDGKCVRLRQGRMDDETIFSEHPVEVATRWVNEGAKRLHIVDLDGAFAGKPVNAQVIHDIAEAHPGLIIQVGGGIRDEDTIQAYLNAGVQYVIIGTKAVNSPHFVGDVCVEFPGHIIVGLDAKDGKVAIDGWSKLSKHDIIDLAQHFESDGVSSIIYTDIGRDGMMKYPKKASSAPSQGVPSTKVAWILLKAKNSRSLTLNMGLAKRIIPCLDVDNGRVVKGVKFVDIRDAGDPVEIAMTQKVPTK